MATIEELLEELRRNPRHVRFRDANRVCRAYFGEPRTHGSHHVFKTSWQGNPRINIQNRKGFVAPYQVSQLLRAIDLMEVLSDEGNR